MADMNAPVCPRPSGLARDASDGSRHQQPCLEPAGNRWTIALSLGRVPAILPFSLRSEMKRPILNGVLIVACLFVFIGCSSLRESHQRAVNEMDQPYPWERPSGGQGEAFGILFQLLLKLFTDPEFFCSNSK